MIRRNTWIVLALFVVLLGVYWLVQRQTNLEAAAVTPTASAQPVFITGFDTVQAVRLEDSSGKVVAIEIDNQGIWSLTEPGIEVADQQAASTLVSQVSNLLSLAIIDSPPAPEVIGLEKPAYTITITSTDGSQQIASIGALTPTNSGYYVQPNVGPLMVVTKGTIDSLVANLDSPPIAPTPTVVEPNIEPAGTPVP